MTFSAASWSARVNPAVAEKPKASASKGCRRACTSPRVCDSAYCTRLKRGWPVGGVEVEEVREAGPPCRPGFVLKGIDARQPAGVAYPRSIKVEGRGGVGRARLHQVVFDIEGDRSVGILARRHAPSIAQIATIAEHHRYLGAGTAIEAIGCLPFVQGVPGTRRVDGGVISL